MLKKIPEILSPQLVKTLMEMGHGDEPFRQPSSSRNSPINQVS